MPFCFSRVLTCWDWGRPGLGAGLFFCRQSTVRAKPSHESGTSTWPWRELAYDGRTFAQPIDSPLWRAAAPGKPMIDRGPVDAVIEQRKNFASRPSWNERANRVLKWRSTFVGRNGSRHHDRTAHGRFVCFLLSHAGRSIARRARSPRVSAPSCSNPAGSTACDLTRPQAIESFCVDLSALFATRRRHRLRCGF